MTAPHSLDRQGAWLIVGSLVFLGLAAALMGWRSSSAPPDPITLCSGGRPIAGEIVILFDATDHPSASELASVVEWFRQFELSGLRQNERVTLWVLGTSAHGTLARRFCRCYPGRETDPVLHNPAMAAAACESLFARPLRDAIEAAGTATPSHRSPILEAIRELSVQPEFVGSSGRKRLIVVSDLEENVPGLSLYRGVPSFARFRSAPLFRQLKSNLHGVPVDVLYLPRGVVGASLSPAITDFWREFFNECGVPSVSFRRL